MEANAGSKEAEKNLKLDEEKPHAGSKQKMEKKVPPTPVPFGFRLSIGQVEEGSEATAGAGRRTKKKVLRLGKEYVDFLAETPLPPPYQPLPSFDPQFMEMQESLVAKQTADREERESILKQYAEYGYACVEIEVTDDEDDEGFGVVLLS